MPDPSTWYPTCPDCGRTTQAVSAAAEDRREALSELRGSQATCPTCGTTFSVDRRTVVREA